MPHPKPNNDYERKLVANIAKYGWQCTSVRSPEDDTDSVNFSYTIGLNSSYGQPEFIIFGLPVETAHSILSLVADAAASGKPIDVSQPSSTLIKNYEVVFVPVPRDQFSEYLGSVIWWEQGKDFAAVQIIWPDKNGLFPWHLNAPESFKMSQPILGIYKDTKE